MLMSTVVAVAQLPHSYVCDFEDEAENDKWVLNKPKNEAYTWVNQWAIDSAIASLGMKSMYISPDGGKSVGYARTESRIMIAWRELQLEEGRYDIAFDWMCGGDSARAALLTAWVPESEFGNMNCMLNDDYKVRKWVKNNMLKYDGTELLTGGSVWTHAVNTIEADGNPHRLVFLFVYSSAAQLVQPGPCVDNIQFSRNNCGNPENKKVTLDGRTVKMSWESTAEEFNLRMHRMGDNYATQIDSIKENSYSAMLQEGVYDIQIRVICEGDTSVWYNFPTAFVHEVMCFDYLDLTDERCSFSMETASDYTQNNDLVYGKIDYGFTSMWSRHTIHYHPEEYDARTFGSVDTEGNSVPKLKTVPDGALASVRVGSWEKMARVARIEYDFTVDAKEASVLMLQYAMVLESSGHETPQRPRLMIDIVNAETGEALSRCTTVDLAAQTSGEGWYRVPDPQYTDGSRDICWRNWETLGLNLAEFDGVHVKVKITVSGCTAEIHYGYAYIVLTCTSGQIKGMHCGWTPTNEFIAPEGFNYRWYKVSMPSETLGRESVFKVDYRDTCTYAVNMTYKSNSGCGFTLYANAIPRFPIPEATYTLEQRNCGNYITIINTSHIRTHNWDTGEEIDTQVRPEYVGWEYNEIIKEGLLSPEAPWKMSFRLPDEEADYEFRLLAGVGLCDSVLTMKVHVPAVGPDSVVEHVERCKDDWYIYRGKYYMSDTLIIERGKNMVGCDSVHTIDLCFVEAIHDTVDVSIIDGETYEFAGQSLTKDGEYTGTFKSAAGCDSIVLLRLKVFVPLAMEITSVESPCYGDASFLINTHARKGTPNAYTLTFDEAGTIAGLQPQSGTMDYSTDSTLTLNLSADMLPGFYPFTVEFSSENNGTTQVTDELIVQHPATLIQQRWDDVLGILNADYNGGYDFVTFQWYRNGVAIDGATEAYLYVEDKLQAGDAYSVELMQPGEQRALSTCEYKVPASAAAPAQKQKMIRNGQLILIIDGKTYNTQGQNIN